MQLIKLNKHLQPKVPIQKIYKGITPAIFLSPYYMKKGEYSMEVNIR